MKKIPGNVVFITAGIILWALFKWIYPHASYFTDSYTYIQAAAGRRLVSIRPIGYSLFLRCVHALSSSETFLVTVQYLLFQGACYYLLFVLRRWFGMSRRTERFLLFFCVLNLPALFLCNYISSDILFTALSLVWIAGLLRWMERPSGWGLTLHIILLLLLFYLRFNALYYPVIATVAFLLSKTSLRYKCVGIVASFLIIAAGVILTRHLTKRQTGTAVFSAFSGWQIANNALHIYSCIPVDTTGLPSPECQDLATRFVRPYFARTAVSQRVTPPSVTTAYMWERGSPLWQYMIANGQQYRWDYFNSWTGVGSTYSKYGYWVIEQHPLDFSRYYLWPSTRSYFFPPLEVLEKYNEGATTIGHMAWYWFHYPSEQLPVPTLAAVQPPLLTTFRWLFLLIHLVFPLLTLFFLTRRRTLVQPSTVYSPLARLLWFTGAYFLVNTGFSIFASPGAFRYQLTSMILLSAVFAILAHFLARSFIVTLKRSDNDLNKMP